MREILVVTGHDGCETRYLLEVLKEGGHWASTLNRFAEGGELETGQAAPRFYGTTEDQARRRTLSMLENQYEDVRSLGGA